MGTQPRNDFFSAGCRITGIRFTDTRHAIACLPAFLILLQFGCISKSGIGQGVLTAGNSPSASEEVKSRLGTIGVSSAILPSQPNRVDTSSMAHGGLEGSMRYGVEGTKVGMAFAYASLPIATIVCVSTIVGCIPALGILAAGAAAPVVGGVTGAIGGALASESKETIDASQNAINKVAATLPIGDLIADQMIATVERNGGKSVHTNELRKAQGSTALEPDSILDTELTELYLAPVAKGEVDVSPPFTLSMTIESKLRRRQDAVQLSAHSVRYRSTGRSLTEWADNDAALLRDELKAASTRIADEMVEFLVFLYPAVVEPLMPPDGDQVRSLKPTLSWVPFEIPRSKGARITKAQGRASDYELRILDGDHVLYDRAGLQQEVHHVDRGLPSCTVLGWRVRARFQLDSITRISRWSSPQSFKTPCYGEPSTWGEKRSEPLHRQVSPEEP